MTGTIRSLAAVFLAAALLSAPAVQAQSVSEAQPAVESDAAAAAGPVLDRLNAAWDAGDGAGFAAQFAADADVINIFGEHFRGGPDLVRRMQFIFDGIFKGSKHVERNLEIARYLDEGTILVVTSSVIAVPQGPLAPETRNRQTFILELDGADWLIRHWQNTTIRPGN
jgi:uncharacterized protein (TIGR02246 family)